MFFVADQLVKRSNNASLRKCSRCEEFKPLSSFSIKDKGKGYLDTRCKACKCEQTKFYQFLKKENVIGY